MTLRSLLVVLLSGPIAAAAAQQAAAAAAQQADFRWEKALAAGSRVSIHNINGDVTVAPSTSGKVEVETSNGITVCAINKRVDMECDERGLRVHDHWGDRDWNDASIDIQVKLPRNLEVDAHSVSGDVSVTGAEGNVRGGSVSGEVRMERLRASSIKASSVSGDVSVGVDALTGNGPLSFTSVSGSVTAELPKTIDADVTMRSVSGTLDSEFPLTLNGRMSRHSLEARIGKGGRDLEVRTVSGDVRLRQSKP